MHPLLSPGSATLTESGYCGEIGKQDTCQAAVSLSLANAWASLPVAFRLYLPKDWAADEERQRKAKVPATEQIRRTCRAAWR